jgi:hypothetical protein
MWNFVGVAEQANWLTFEPLRILYEFDVPYIFICSDVPGNTYLAYLCGRDQQEVRYLVVPCSEDLERRLVTGDINLRDALTQYRAWLFDLDNQWNPLRAWKVNVDSLPADVLPKPGVMIYAHLPPVANPLKARPWANEVEMVYDPPTPSPWMRSGVHVHA